MAKISVLLPTFNEEKNIAACFESVKWADEILVVDSFSTDRTLEIAQRYGARIIQHEYINSACQKNWAIPQCAYEWVLQIDADEVLEEGAAAEIRSVILDAPLEINAFRMPRRNHFLGKWIRHAGMYPDYQTRLIRRDIGRWVEREVHAHIHASKTGILQHHILHAGAPYLSKQLHNLNRYTRYEADEMIKNRIKFHGRKLIFHPWLIFLYRYVWQQGWRDGWRGFIICAYLAIYSFLSYAKLWEIEELGLEYSPK
ncbi:MAG: glycosyltransferase family 2 protein [Anaerolineae bacterium]